MKASVTRTETLKLRSRAGSRLASMKCSMSGWSIRRHRHHGAASLSGRHHGPAHRIPRVHERERPGSLGADAAHWRACGPDGGEIHTDAAALLHGQRRFAQVLENAVEIVRYRAHHEAIEQRDRAAGAGAGDDAARWQELKSPSALFKLARANGDARAAAPLRRCRGYARPRRLRCRRRPHAPSNSGSDTSRSRFQLRLSRRKPSGSSPSFAYVYVRQSA
jgi:hypothetical protein